MLIDTSMLIFGKLLMWINPALPPSVSRLDQEARPLYVKRAADCATLLYKTFNYTATLNKKSSFVNYYFTMI